MTNTTINYYNQILGSTTKTSSIFYDLKIIGPNRRTQPTITNKRNNQLLVSAEQKTPEQRQRTQQHSAMTQQSTTGCRTNERKTSGDINNTTINYVLSNERTDNTTSSYNDNSMQPDNQDNMQQSN